MGTSLSGLTPATTFDGLLKVGDNDPLTANLKAISDGSGNDSAIQLSTGELKVIGQATMAGLTNNTSASAILAQNSDGYNLLQVRNDGTTIINNNAYSFSQPRFTSTKEIVIHQGLSVGQTASPTAARLHIKGSGTTSATTSLLVQNSDGTELLNVQDDGIIDSQYLRLNGASPSPLISAEGNAGKAVRLGNEGYFSSFNYLELKTWDGTSYSPVIRVTGNTTQNVGIGETTPTARLHVKGSGNDNTTTSLLVQNSDGTEHLKVTDDGVVNVRSGLYVNHPTISSRFLSLSWGAISSNSTSDELSLYGGGVTLGSIIYLNASAKATAPKAIGMKTDGVLIAPSMSQSSFAPSAQLHIKGSGNDATTTALLVQNSNGDDLAKVDDSGNISAISSSIGHTAQVPYIRSFIKGIGATSATSSLLVVNSAGNELMKVIDDGAVYFSKANWYTYTAGPSILRSTNGGGFRFYTGGDAMEIQSTGVGIGTNSPTARLHVASDEQGLKIRAGSTTSHNILDIADASGSKGLLYRAGDGVIQFYGQTFNLESQSSNGNIRLNSGSASGGVGINVTPAAFTRMHIKGQGATVATTALLVQNSAGENALQIKDNKESIFSGITTFDNNVNLKGANGTSSLNNLRFVVPGSAKSLTINKDYSFTNEASALVDIQSTTQGFLPPRMRTGEKNAITSPAPGLMVYDTDANQMSYWNGGAWINF